MSESQLTPASLPDYSALQQVARALWRNGSSRGAALLVGAGFSRNAELASPDSPAPPVWWQLQDQMAERLYPKDMSRAPDTALRVAEEYRSYFGQAALDDFIREHCPDQSWLPGTLHAKLLDLPWVDILTTNWDTLLERSAQECIEHAYETVRTDADLTYARSPRIVKLHGTLGDAGRLIFTEEDFRTYPAKHAAFVNLARQVFIENELCMLGFSGQDPNFLEWAGWVRDHLGGNARRIYLVGNLNLESAARRHLESQNISPIDLYPLVRHLPTEEQHKAATSLFLQALTQEKPIPAHEWARTSQQQFPRAKLTREDQERRLFKDDHFAAQILEATVQCYKSDREMYPGWLVCPANHRDSIGRGWEYPFLRKPVLNLLPPRQRADALAQILWRRTLAFRPLERELVEAMTELMEPQAADIDASLRHEFAVALIRHARLSADSTAIARWADLVLSEAPPDAPIRQEVYYQLVLHARDKLDFSGLEKGLKQLTSDDPLWQLRRAALHADIANYKEASRLIKAALSDLERRLRLNRKSIITKSRLAWANWIGSALAYGDFSNTVQKPRPLNFSDLEIDPWEELQHLNNEAIAIEKKQTQEGAATIQPSFAPGSYREVPKTTYEEGGAPGALLQYQLDQLIELVGLPTSINHVDVCRGRLIEAARLSHEPNFLWYARLIRTAPSSENPAFQQHLARVPMARLDASVSAALTSSVEGSVSYWAKRVRVPYDPERGGERGRAVDELRVSLAALARLTVRMSVEKAEASFSLAMTLASDAHVWHPWLLTDLAQLAEHAALAIPLERQGALALSVLMTPLTGERKVNPGPRQIDLINTIRGSTPVRDPTDLRWDTRIQQIIGACQKGQPDREQAIMRLSYLAERNVLSAAETADFARALWSALDAQSNGLPTDTGLLLAHIADLPAPDGVDVKATLAARFFDADLKEQMSLGPHLNTVAAADKRNFMTSLSRLPQFQIFPSAQRAAQMFDELVSWQAPAIPATDPLRGFNFRFVAIIALPFTQIQSVSCHLVTRRIKPSAAAIHRTFAQVTPSKERNIDKQPSLFA